MTKLVKDKNSESMVEAMRRIADFVEKEGLPEQIHSVLASMMESIARIVSGEALGGASLIHWRDKEKKQNFVSQGWFVGDNVPLALWYEMSGRLGMVAQKLADEAGERDCAAVESREHREKGNLN
jgi:hypothetical protein